MRFRILLCLTWLLLGLVLSGRTLHAQNFSPQTAEGQIERSRLPNPVLPLSPGSLSIGEPPESTDSATDPRAPNAEGDSDLGVQSLLRAHDRPRPWSLLAAGGVI